LAEYWKINAYKHIKQGKLVSREERQDYIQSLRINAELNGKKVVEMTADPTSISNNAKAT